MILGRRWWFELDFAYSLFAYVRYVSNPLKCALKVQYSRAEILATDFGKTLEVIHLHGEMPLSVHPD